MAAVLLSFQSLRAAAAALFALSGAKSLDLVFDGGSHCVLTYLLFFGIAATALGAVIVLTVKIERGRDGDLSDDQGNVIHRATKRSESDTPSNPVPIGVEVRNWAATRVLTDSDWSPQDQWIVTVDFRVTNRSNSTRVSIDLSIVEPREIDGRKTICGIEWQGREAIFPVPKVWPVVGDALSFPLAVDPQQTVKGQVEFCHPALRAGDGGKLFGSEAKLRVIDHVSDAYVELPLYGGRYP